MNIVQAIKKCAMDAMEAAIPCDVLFGEVESSEPLRVKVGETSLPEDLLIVSKNLEYKAVSVTFSIYEREIVVNEGIKEGDVLVLIRKGGGEKYIAVGKV